MVALPDLLERNSSISNLLRLTTIDVVDEVVVVVVVVVVDLMRHKMVGVVSKLERRILKFLSFNFGLWRM